MTTDKSKKQLERQHAAKKLCTLAHTYNPDKHDIKGWMAFPKLDGMRMIFKGGSALTRTGKPINIPEDLWEELTDLSILLNNFQIVSIDGELIHNNGFNSTVSAARKLVPVKEEWESMTFHIFDWYYSNVSTPKFIDRYLKLLETIEKEDYKYLTPVFAYSPDLDPKHIPKLLKSSEGNGYEGLILRNPKADYDFGRSHNLLKVKSSQDIEVTVKGIEKGTGKHSDRMGTLVCELDNGKPVRVGTGFTDEERENPPPIGSRITIEFFEYTEKGIPRHPRYKTIRDYE